MEKKSIPVKRPQTPLSPGANLTMSRFKQLIKLMHAQNIQKLQVGDIIIELQPAQ